VKKKSVIFIEPAGRLSNVFENYMKLPLMGTLYLGTILHERGYDVRIINENIIDKEIDPFEIRADVFCITALTVSANRAKILARQIRETYSESRIIMGGTHASVSPEEFTDIADHVVIGEAEEIIEDLIEGRFQDKIVHGSHIKDLEALPLVNYALMEGFDNMSILPIMTSRGCPFDCSFCTVTQIFGKKFRMQSAERVVAEVENALKHFKNRNFFFYDDNFTASKNRIKLLCDLLMQQKLNISWAAQVRADVARDPELVRKMAVAVCRWVYIGFESINDEALKAMHKSQTRSDIEKTIRILRDAGIRIHGMFIFGDDHDTLETMNATVDFAIKNEIDTVQFMVLTPFPGTQIYEAIVGENRLLHKNWDYYNAMFIVFRPKRMQPHRLLHGTHLAYRRFYSLRRTFMDTVWLGFNAFVDALVWNFQSSTRYTLDLIFMRAGAKTIIGKYSRLYKTYGEYLDSIEKNAVLNGNDHS
jgi:radical SAM superfamily enzyme YgiQ (UPF0313 family)